MRAPYVKLTPIASDDDMVVDNAGARKVVQQRQSENTAMIATLVSS
jgi:hypothetical protein